MSWQEPFLRWRDRRLADPAFQGWLAGLPLIGALARRKAAQAFDLCAGFVYSQVLQACIEVDLLGLVRTGPLSLESIREGTGLPAAGAERLVRAAAALDLLAPRGPGYGLGETGAALLGNPGVFSMIRHHKLLYEDLVDPVELLGARRTDTRLARYWAYAGEAEPGQVKTESVSDYSDLMAQTQAFIAAEILHACDFRKSHHVMDVGGGAGAFLEALGRAHPSLSLTLCDLPGVVPLAETRLTEVFPGREIRYAGRDMFRDRLPGGADTVTLVRILHDHDDDQIRILLSAIRKALPEFGRLIIAEPMAATPGAQAMGDAYFGLYLWAMASGRPRSFAEIRCFLNEAGFAHVRERRSRQPLLTRVIEAL